MLPTAMKTILPAAAVAALFLSVSVHADQSFEEYEKERKARAAANKIENDKFDKEREEYKARVDALIKRCEATSAKDKERQRKLRPSQRGGLSDTDAIIDAIERNGCRH